MEHASAGQAGCGLGGATKIDVGVEFNKTDWSPRLDRVDKEIDDQYSFLFAATAFFGSDACGALSHLNPDAE
jgi:hypothetical protein